MTPEEIGKAMAELIAMGHMRHAGQNEAGEPLYQLTRAGIEHVEKMIADGAKSPCPTHPTPEKP